MKTSTNRHALVAALVTSIWVILAIMVLFERTASDAKTAEGTRKAAVDAKIAVVTAQADKVVANLKKTAAEMNEVNNPGAAAEKEERIHEIAEGMRRAQASPIP